MLTIFIWLARIFGTTKVNSILDINTCIYSRGPFIVGGCYNDLKDDMAIESSNFIALSND